VAAWRVLAGKSAGSLTALATIPDTGFESSTTLPEKYAAVQVQALGPGGRVLGTSQRTGVVSYAASLPAAESGQ